MQTLETDGAVVPVLVYNQKNEFISAHLQNEKARLKSLEQKELWIVDGSTGRILPLEMIGYFQSIEQKSGHNICHIALTNMTKSDYERVVKKESSIQDGVFPFGLEKLIHERKKEMPEGSYTTHLFQKGLSKIKKKTGEETIELLLAEKHEEIVSEACDLIYHMTVLFVEQKITWKEIITELEKR